MKTKAKHQNARFCVISEENISPDLDKAIRETLVVCFPSDREHFQRYSWWHCVPVYRVLGRDDRDSIVAHTAVVERSVTVGRNLTKVRVAGVQSFCVLPDYRGTGLSDRMMSITMEEANRRGFDTGLLFCLNRMETVYGRMGWQKLDSEVYMRDDKACCVLAPPGEPRREGKMPIPAKNITMFYPLGVRQFPPGDIDLAGTDW
ncbi:MAG TPA: GNAT family N-acetyltransferase [Sedimentisphaerales bacterium]|nr:GNAT family N-acetyltransferase [Sedimentisphaerales bacterium]